MPPAFVRQAAGMIAGVVLAAGLSRRMGKAKLLLPLDGKPILRWSVEALQPHVDQLVVVVPPDDAAIRSALDGLGVRFATNPQPDAGQGTSVATGVKALPRDATAAVIALGDQPRLPDGLLRDLLATFSSSGKPIAAPVYRGVQGTPVVFAASVFGELRTLEGDAGARAVVRRDPRRVSTLAVDADMPFDVDTPDDYARLSGEP
jgi:molybdenum cofactor cytidylyltransferase